MTLQESYEKALARKRASLLNPIALTISQAVAVLGVSRTGIYAAIKSGALIARKRGYRTLILFDDLKRWLKGLPVLDTRKNSAGFRVEG